MDENGKANKLIGMLSRLEKLMLGHGFKLAWRISSMYSGLDSLQWGAVPFERHEGKVHVEIKIGEEMGKNADIFEPPSKCRFSYNLRSDDGGGVYDFEFVADYGGDVGEVRYEIDVGKRDALSTLGSVESVIKRFCSVGGDECDGPIAIQAENQG